MTRPTDLLALSVTDEAQSNYGSDAVPPPPPPPLSGLDAAGLFGAAVPAYGADRITPFSAIQPLFPAYEFVATAGAGGAGAVYRARHRKLDREVAIKILHPERGNDSGFAERFRREARAIARLEHPFIVGIHDFGDAEGVHYLALEWCGGGTLRGLLGGDLEDRRRALRVLAFACEAVDHAHRSGTVHRDLKPENVLLDAHGYPRVADFGLARYRDPDTPTLTVTGDVMGTPHYMAPEQLAGREAGASADVYALGVMVYEALTGSLPAGRFRAPGEVEGALCADLDQIVMAALDVDPAQRPDLRSLRAALLRSTSRLALAASSEETKSRKVAAVAGEELAAAAASSGPQAESSQGPAQFGWRLLAIGLVTLSTFLPFAFFGMSGLVPARITAWGWSATVFGGLPVWSLTGVFLIDALLWIQARAESRPIRPNWFPWLTAAVALWAGLSVLLFSAGVLLGFADFAAVGPVSLESVRLGPGILTALLGYGGVAATTWLEWSRSAPRVREARRTGGSNASPRRARLRRRLAKHRDA